MGGTGSTSRMLREAMIAVLMGRRVALVFLTGKVARMYERVAERLAKRIGIPNAMKHLLFVGERSARANDCTKPTLGGYEVWFDHSVDGSEW
jgi:acid phosphatase class B